MDKVYEAIADLTIDWREAENLLSIMETTLAGNPPREDDAQVIIKLWSALALACGRAITEKRPVRINHVVRQLK